MKKRSREVRGHGFGNPFIEAFELRILMSAVHIEAGGAAGSLAATAVLASSDVSATSTLLSTGTYSPIAGKPIQVTAIVSSETIPKGSVTLTDTYLSVTTVLTSAPLINGAALITIPSLGAGRHYLQAIYTPSSNNAASSSNYVTIDATMPTVIDILALYTASALEEQAKYITPGVAGILSRIESEVSDVNVFLSKSQIPVTVRLAGLTEVNYSESGSYATDLERLATPNDGYMDNVASLRNAFGADVVVLLNAKATSTESGIAREFNSYGTSWEQNGFAVVDFYSVYGNTILAHELGHVLGAGHAVGDPQGNIVAAPYGHGYVFQGKSGFYYHDIMAYEVGSDLYTYSNPNIIVDGVPSGDAKTANAARVMSEKAPVVAAYRNAAPLVYVDVLNLRVLEGWAFDPRAVDSSTLLRVEIDGQVRGNIVADRSRIDLLNLIGNTNHGFLWNLPVLSPGSHKVVLRAVDVVTGQAVLAATIPLIVPPPLFDEVYYLATNPDIAAAVRNGVFTSGWQHFSLYGQYEGRNPSQYFDQAYYLAQNPDVAAAVLNGTIKSAFQHFVLYGQREGRKASVNFSEAFYLSQYPDIAAAVRAGYLHSGLEHYLLYGQFEGRKPLP